MVKILLAIFVKRPIKPLGKLIQTPQRRSFEKIFFSSGRCKRRKRLWKQSESEFVNGAHDPPTEPQLWETEKKTDLSVGTYPEGSTWRYQGPIDYVEFKERFYKDHVVEPGEYVLSWRWDSGNAPQVWVSCSNIEIVD